MSLSLENVRVYTQSAIRIEGARGTVAYLDPFSLTDAEAAHDADYVLITHAHYDHLSPEDYARVAGEKTVVVAPASMASEVAGLGAAATHLMRAGEKLELPGLTVEAVPAYNVEPERLAMHPQANGWLGYVLALDGEPTRYYVSGDTDQNVDNEVVRCDVALVPIGGTYTCDPRQAATLVNALRPAVVVPTHYGSIVGTYADFDAFAAAVDPAIAVVRKLER
ncbi:MBL fold metallo-hydrolase [Thermophilibacter sp. ET337]|uniref:MBL fold metallo-hydrolase n=1 Tax=Thermophilibacter sp. ET337 TaxID=2973084 RepID=UPI0021AC2625|nr:MBL fold metallo-hydrolase [Thermophilibacter sp. ET337]MCR8907048.1 MBL fold metallo-hydrolase [Thermophilibacter sp. ET337]